jgi:nucleoside-diphosphate-sugar epimerase
MDLTKIINREETFFSNDMKKFNEKIRKQLCEAKVLIIGAAGSIGQAVTKEILSRNPKAVHAIDISENNLVELVRFIRSSVGYVDCDFRTFAIDCASLEFDFLCDSEGPYDYILNFSALKHVRSEKDPYTLMRMIEVNILNSLKLLDIAKSHNSKNLFCISTDKASNPVNMMGASKRIMEKFLINKSEGQKITMARFANVAFSDGSLLHGFQRRFDHKQPISAPNDVKRYFITPTEAGQLCLISAMLGNHNQIFFPSLLGEENLDTFSNIADRYLKVNGFEPVECISEEEARSKVIYLINKKKWPVYYFKSDTTGEKPTEEFFTKHELLDFTKFEGIGIINNAVDNELIELDTFLSEIQKLRSKKCWTKESLIPLFKMVVPEFTHEEKGKSLDEKM